MNLEGRKELLGLWLGENEGTKFWLACLTDLKNRGLNDIFVACIDGLSGFPDAIRAAYPQIADGFAKQASAWAICTGKNDWARRALAKGPIFRLFPVATIKPVTIAIGGCGPLLGIASLSHERRCDFRDEPPVN